MMIAKKIWKGVSLGAAMALLGGVAPSAEATEDFTKESVEKMDERMAWWNEARFGMFVHWGLYAIPGGSWDGKEIDGYAEWIQATADIPADEYAKLAPQFRPDAFDAEAWVKAAKGAGMKYLVITTKHHDGFCLWPSAHTDFDLGEASPFQRDILGELSAACKKHGVRFGTYYSIIDWHHPSQERTAGGKGHWGKWGQITMKPGRKAEYVKYMKAQIRELIERYDTDILWFDGDWVNWWTLEDGDDLYNYIRGLKPSIVINNRVSKRRAFKRDFGTPENQTPGAALDHHWEACWTMNHSWGFKAHDHTWKSNEVLIQKLVDINSKGGNLLLNVGPLADGRIPEKSLKGLAAMGGWMKTNGEAIYGTRFSGFEPQAWGRVTAKGDQALYLHVFKAPADGVIRLAGIKAKGVKATLMGAGALQVKADGEELSVSLPKGMPNDAASVVRLDMPQGYEVVKSVGGLKLEGDDRYLDAGNALISSGGPLRIQKKHAGLGGWTGADPQQSAKWEFELVVPGKHRVLAYCAVPKAAAGGELVLESAHGNLSHKFEATGGKGHVYQMVDLGVIDFPQLNRESLTMKAADVTKRKVHAIGVKGIVLRPLK